MKTRLQYFTSILLSLSALLFVQCGTSVYYVKPPDWQDLFKRDSTLAAYADVLKGVTVFVDPGHGGDNRAGIGPRKEVVEADLNLRVAMRLREYLKRAGANVIMSRETDVSLSPAARAQQANANNADAFISIHHNAAENPYTNYTATFYHARQGDIGYKPSSHDLARYIQRDLAYVMGNPSSLASFDGTMSDYKIYPGEGFAVLRETKMTAVLVECAFFTSAYEEQRLKLQEFNDIEAWGIFRGIAKYLKAGIPTLKYISPVLFKENRPKLELLASNPSDIPDESIRGYVDGKEAGSSFSAKTGKIAFFPAEELPNGYHVLSAQVRNSNENSSAPFQVYFAVGNAPAYLRYTADPPTLPPDESAFSILTITAVDSAGALVQDELPLHFKASNGIDTTLLMRGGMLRTYMYPGFQDKITFEASNGPVKTEGVIPISKEALYTRGLVMSSDGKPVDGASLLFSGGKTISTNANGEYIIAGSSTSGLEVLVKATGYYGKREALNANRVQDPIVLAPVANGVLQGRTVILDAPSVSGAHPARMDSSVLAHLEELLAASGAKTLNAPVIAKSKKEKQELFAAHHDGIVLFLGEQSKNAKASIRVNGLPASKKLGEAIAKAFPQYTGAGVQPVIQRMMPQDELEKTTQVSVSLPIPAGKNVDERVRSLYGWNAAWALYSAILSQGGYKVKGTRNLEVTITDKEKNAPAPYVLIELNHSLRAMTDAKGTCRFRGVNVSDEDIRVPDPEKYEVAGVKSEVIN